MAYGDRTQAVTLYRRALRLTPDDPALEAKLAYGVAKVGG